MLSAVYLSIILLEPGLEKSVDMLFARIFPPREKTLNGAGQPRVNLLSNARYITVVGMKTYMDV